MNPWDGEEHWKQNSNIAIPINVCMCNKQQTRNNRAICNSTNGGKSKILLSY